MDDPAQANRTHLFVLRLWLEPLGEGRAEIRGEVRHLLSGRRHRFRDWAALAAFMAECAIERDPASSDPQPADSGDADTTQWEKK